MFTQHAADARGIEIINGNVKCLGGMVGVDDAAATAWLKDKLVRQSPITNAIKDSRFPLIHALRCAKINNIPKPIFLLRAMPLRITQEAISAFDRANRLALIPRLLRCSRPLPPSALISLTQPGRNGGMGLLELEVIASAARWASAAAAAPDLQCYSAPFASRAPYHLSLTGKLPLTCSNNAVSHACRQDNPLRSMTIPSNTSRPSHTALMTSLILSTNAVFPAWPACSGASQSGSSTSASTRSSTPKTARMLTCSGSPLAATRARPDGCSPTQRSQPSPTLPLL